MAEPDWFSVDEAARALKAYDQGTDVEPEVWEHDTPDAEVRTTGAKLHASPLF
ncbi:hypothetical protein SAMN04489740_4277 [Arthrobacter alpinus]|uniref:Uncharacterized protein n=1 Tax=Arthrobacter alpinus TaxID=656366 RepID=A0A1H5PG72_9MICC|nr:hypothetical protein [Arthrobacter alpinus]SEF12706.1 hypothetical protein SAMN04489740_4277 [Arthrobacter alpinus]